MAYLEFGQQYSVFMSKTRKLFLAKYRRRLPIFARHTLCIGLLVLSPLMSHAEDTLETKVKAAYLYHLLNYINWPVLPGDALHICVFGDDTLGAMLRELSDRKVKNLPLNIEMNGFDKLMACQVIFIGNRLANWQELLATLPDTSILTVGDPDGFAAQGGVVGFYSLDGKIKLELNPQAAQRANLRISSKLLDMARIVSLP